MRNRTKTALKRIFSIVVSRGGKVVRNSFVKRYFVFAVAVSMVSILAVIIQSVFALDETTYTIGSGGDTEFTAGTPSNVAVTESEVQLDKNSTWYDLGWDYNRQLTVHNESSSTINATATVSVTVGVQGLESVRDDCNDVRIVYDNGGTLTELVHSYFLDEDATNCSDAEAMTVSFPLQAGIASGGSDSNYYLYYGNSSASDPGYGDDGFDVGAKEALFVCPFGGGLDCLGGETPTTSTGAIRYSGQKGGLEFDGTNDYVSGGALECGTQFTFELWFKPDKLGGAGAYGQLFRLPGRFQLLFYQQSAYLYIFRDGGTDAYTASVGNTVGVWQHLAVTYDDSSHTAKFYKDGVYKGQATNSNDMLSTATSLWLLSFISPFHFDGVMDEVRVSDTIRYSDDFTPQTEPFLPDENTRLLLHFDENGDDPRYSGKVIDASGQGNHGTIFGPTHVSGLVGVNENVFDTGKLSFQSYASHQGVFVEEGTTNKVTNPSFENGTAWDTGWGRNYVNYDSALHTFAESIGKRTTAGPFITAPLLQGSIIPDSNGDTISYSRGSEVLSNGTFFSSNVDTNQGSIVFWITPEWNGDDNLEHIILDYGNYNVVKKTSSNTLYFRPNYLVEHAVDISGWAAGNTYNIVLSWDLDNPLDGTNYVCIYVNDVRSCGDSSTYDPLGTAQTNSILGPDADAVIEGLAIYRRPLSDGTYGINAGNGDEIALIYNSGVGKDPATVTGSWDTVVSIPTNSANEGLSAGTGNAWSHPHDGTSQLLDDWFMFADDKGYGGGPIVDLNDDNTAYVNLGSDSGLDDLHDNEFTAEGWFRYDEDDSVANTIFGKYDYTNVLGWVVFKDSASQVAARACDNTQTVTGVSSTDTLVNDGKWHHFAMYFNDAGDRKVYLALDGEWFVSSTAMSNPVGSDASLNLYMGRNSNSESWLFDGGLGWFRISDSDRYNHGVDFVPPVAPPAVDGNTIAQWNMSEGSGSNLDNAEGTESRDGTITNGTWTIYPWHVEGSPTKFYDLASLDKVYPGGYSLSSDSANEGIYQDIMVESGGDWVVRGVAHSDGTSIPRLVLYDQSNGAEIGSLTGTNLSTRTKPNIFIFTGEAPSGCTTLRVKLINTQSSGTLYWHQVELLGNMITNPSAESWQGTDPDTPIGWTNSGIDVGEGYSNNTDVHSGTYSAEMSTDYAWEYWKQGGDHGLSQGKFYSHGKWNKYIGGGAFVLELSGLSFQGGSSFGWIGGTSGLWKHFSAVFRANSDSGFVYERGNAPGVHILIDDSYFFPLSDISLTVAPASEANSLESTGLRVDGRDTLTQDPGTLSGTADRFKFEFTPRHNFDIAENFGNANPVIFSLYGDADDYIKLYKVDDSTLRLSASFAASVVNADWTDPPVLNSEMTYSFEIGYVIGGALTLKVDGVIEGSSAIDGGYSFGTVPTIIYFGSDENGANQYDATIDEFLKVLPSDNASAMYTKFGGHSAKLLNSGTVADEYLVLLDPDSTSTHILSAYVYAFTVDSTVAELYYNDDVITTSYENTGGNWWRLTGSVTPVDAPRYYGVQVKGGQTVYVDGVQLEENYTCTSYADGSLGTGYSWSGVAHESTSTRTGGVLTYQTSGNVDATKGTASFWVKPNWDQDDANHYLLSIGGANGIGIAHHNNSGGLLYVYADGSTRITEVLSGWTSGDWHLITMTWDASQGEIKLYLNDGAPSSGVFTTPTLGSEISVGSKVDALKQSGSVISDLRIFDDVLSATEVAELYNQGLMNHQESDTLIDKYAATGTWTSPTIDLGSAGLWGVSTNFNPTETLNSNTITYETRTSENGVDWSEYSEVLGTPPNFDIQSDPNRYMQIKATLDSTNTDQATTPLITGISFNYVEDANPPPTNASNIAMYHTNGGGPVLSEEWTNSSAPYFTWDAGADGGGESGLRGYCAYLGTDPGGDPATAKGILGTSPGSIANTTCQYVITDEFIDFVNEVLRGDPWLASSNDLYYFKLKAVDNTGNVYAGDSAQFAFYFDNTEPENPDAISAPQQYQREITDFIIYWATSGPTGPEDTHSGVKGFQYRIEDGLWYGPGHVGSEDCEDLFTVGTYTLDPEYDTLSVGENVFYLRTWDNACNVTSTYATAVLKYSADAPSAPRNLEVVPTVNDENAFSFTWDPPETYSGQESGLVYCYTVNTLPSNTQCIWTSGTSLWEDAYANQPGTNTLYLVAKDEAGNVNFGDYASVEFTANTSAPGIPSGVDISDISIKTTESWKLAITWDVPEEQGSGVASYSVYRSEVEVECSTDSSSYSKIGSTAGTSFVDAGLEQQYYYYCVKACDSANNCSAFSETVSEFPTGRFREPAELTSGPEVVSVSTRSGTIEWITNRDSDSRIQYGLNAGEYFEEEVANSDQTPIHSISINNLLPGTTYYYRATWTDVDGNTGISNEHSFTTDPPPALKDVSVEKIGITTAIIKFTSIGAARARIYYGPNGAMNIMEDLNISVQESQYAAILEGLTEGTAYTYKVNLFDTEEEEYEGEYHTFATLPRPKITNVQIEEVRGTAQPTIKVVWESNTEVSSVVEYYPENNSGQPRDQVDLELIQGEHEMRIQGLLPETKYILIVRGVDGFGNEAVSDEHRFTTATDTRPPRISKVEVEGNIVSPEVQPDRERAAQLIISWETDELATSQVEFGEGSGEVYVQKSPVDADLKYNHLVVISNLNPSKVYHIRSLSVDVAGNISESPDVVAITPKTTNNVVELIFGSLLDIFGFLR